MENLIWKMLTNHPQSLEDLIEDQTVPVVLPLPTEVPLYGITVYGHHISRKRTLRKGANHGISLNGMSKVRKRILRKRILRKRMSQKRMLRKRMLWKRMLWKRMLRKRMLRKRIFKLCLWGVYPEVLRVYAQNS